MNSNNNLLNSGVQAFFDTWKSQFEAPPKMDCPFEVTADGHVCVKGVVLCHGNELDLINSSCDVESMLLVIKSGTTFTVAIEWPYDGIVDVSYVLKTEKIYSATA